jgi:hypothetical protein
MCNLDDNFKEYEMGGTCSMHQENQKYLHKFCTMAWSKDHFADFKIILKWILHR